MFPYPFRSPSGNTIQWFSDTYIIFSCGKQLFGCILFGFVLLWGEVSFRSKSGVKWSSQLTRPSG